MRRLFSLAVAALTFASAAQAQGAFTLTINQAQSNFNWSGTSTLGAIVGNPSTAFQMTGTSGMVLTPLAADAIDSGVFSGAGSAAVTPDLHGKINNILPFLPPLATIDITNLSLSFSASSFAIASNGAFSANVSVTALSGSLLVTPLTGAPSTTPLTGLASTPQPQAGSLTQSGSNLQLSLPVNTTFPFADPGTGASGSITIVGTLKADWACPAAAIYCTAKVNSLGCTPAIAVSGVASYTSNAPCTISATNIISDRSGLLFYGFGVNNTPFQGGVLCVATPTVRTLIQTSGGAPGGVDCSGSFAFDMNAHIQSFIDPNLFPGQNVHSQYWSRDPQSPSTTNLTNAARVTICP